MKDSIPKIIIHDVEYEYENGTKALKGINLNIKEGEILGIMGKNGAGKTTLIRTFNGLIRPTRGKIFIDSKDSSSQTIATLSKKVGVIFQNPYHQVFSSTVKNEIIFSLKNLNLSEEELEKKVEETLQKFNLKKYEDRSPLNLSGGETKKLSIAAILCRDPEILVFDEPTLGQDAKEIKSLTDIIKKEQAKGKTIIIVTHNIEFAMEHFKRTVLMADGKILGDGPTSQVLTNGNLIKMTSLILPQVYQFNKLLQENGIMSSKEIYSRQDMINFLSNYLKNYQER